MATVMVDIHRASGLVVHQTLGAVLQGAGFIKAITCVWGSAVVVFAINIAGIEGVATAKLLASVAPRCPLFPSDQLILPFAALQPPPPPP